jgi:hypothetical protein
MPLPTDQDIEAELVSWLGDGTLGEDIEAEVADFTDTFAADREADGEEPLTPDETAHLRRTVRTWLVAKAQEQADEAQKGTAA